MADAIYSLLQSDSGETRTVLVGYDESQQINEPVTGGILPGSFSPLHEGHERLAQVGGELLGATVTFEISIANVDKPPLEEDEVRERLGQFRGRWPVVLTRAPRFWNKAALFPGCTFIIGWDTAARLVSPRYYEGSDAAMDEALTQIQEEGCRFLVAGRVYDGVFRTLSDVAIPQDSIDMFQDIPESRFRIDLSSSEIRWSSAT